MQNVSGRVKQEKKKPRKKARSKERGPKGGHHETLHSYYRIKEEGIGLAEHRPRQGGEATFQKDGLGDDGSGGEQVFWAEKRKTRREKKSEEHDDTNGKKV